jgi:protein SPA2
MRALQKELDELKETRQREKERESRRVRQDEEELQILRDRCEKLEQDRENQRGIVCIFRLSWISIALTFFLQMADPDIIDQLRGDIQGLMLELGDLSRRNDELMTAKDSDLIVIRDLNEQLKEYKRKYEQAKTELRSVKGWSHLLRLRVLFITFFCSYITAVPTSAQIWERCPSSHQ